jgi:predicted RNA-binding Zn-ribbon protein involved in translation (DUF1610 family)
MHQIDIALARKFGIGQRVADMRCPKCSSSRMAKEQLDGCPECGYEGAPVDINAPKEIVQEIAVPKPELKDVPEASGVNPNLSGNELQPKVDAAGATSGSAMERFKAKQRAHMNGGAQNGG